ncbi:MAG: hypothetical protein AAGA20_09305 [Planctomycetota bacterium]
MRRAAIGDRRAGVTLVELILATGLAALVVASTVSIVDSVLELWTRGETVRQTREEGSAVLGLMARDLRQLHAGRRGDLLVDWAPFDVERDGTIERLWPRLRFVRDASPREVARVERRELALAARAIRDARRAELGDDAVPEAEQLRAEELLEAAGLTREEAALGLLGARDVAASELVEVLYAVIPEDDRGGRQYVGTLYRAEHVQRPDEPPVLLGDGAFDQSGVPDLTIAREVARGVLWMRPLMATQTTTLGGALASDGTSDPTGWSVGEGLAAAATSWDAWRLGRPEVDESAWNEPAAGMPRTGDRPLLPRRVRVELEVQRPQDFDRAPRLIGVADEGATSFEVTSTKRLSRVVGRQVLVDGEWMRLTGVSGDRVTVRRATRGTTARTHAAGARVLFGEVVVIDVPIALHEDDWRLAPEEAER